MKRYVILDKKVGETPLSAIQAWKSQYPALTDVPASYAGRLDPMASGKLLVLLGKECRRQRAYTKLDKEYEIEVLLDIGSDTGDVLGMPACVEKETVFDEKILDAVLLREHGAYMRTYPVFSSKTVAGKPLFLYALEGSIASIKIPEHIEHIYSICRTSSYVLSSKQLQEKISELLHRVPRTTEPSKRLGEDFRIDAIRAEWESVFENTPERNFLVLRLRAICASGTYMRSLAGRLGETLGTKALALSITRTRMGKYISISKGFGFWLRTY